MVNDLPPMRHEIVIIDDFSTDPATVAELKLADHIATVHQHSLAGHFGNHKNFGDSKCKCDYIFQIDADEYPTDTLLFNLPELIELNPTVDLFRIPRVNLVRGLTPAHASKWGWQVYQLDGYPGIPVVNRDDHQGRLYRNDPNIRWAGAVHERIVGAKVVSTIPFDPDFALIHDKDISKQEKQNAFYEQNFKP